MSTCCSVSSTNEPFESSFPCIRHPLTKAALFVIAFLLAGGAIASYFTALGTAAVTLFSIASLATFVSACVIAVRRPMPPLKESPVAELLLSLPSYDFFHLKPNEIRLTKEEGEICEELGRYFREILADDPDREALQSMIDTLWNEPNKLFLLVDCILEDAPLNLSSLTILLEESKWPNEKIKRAILLKSLSHVLRHYIRFDPGPSSVTLLVRLDNLLRDHKSFPPLLFSALGLAIRNFLASYAEHVNEQVDIEMRFQVSEKCPVPASAMIPTLGFLKSLEKLTLLDLSNIGTEKGCGFTDGDFDLLIEILEKNPRLIELHVNTESMSNKKREAFELQKELIIGGR